jgi:predicted phosphodiesterase
MAVLGWPRQRSWGVAPHRAVESLKVVFYTDVHGRLEWQTPVAMGRAAAAMTAEQADLVLCGGDMITDGFSSSRADVAARWQAYMETMHAAIEPTPVAALGNHDLVGVAPQGGGAAEADPRIDFRERMGVERTYRSFDAHGYHVMVLDSVRVDGSEYPYVGEVDEAQLAWMAEDLGAIEPGTPIVVLTHIPLLTSFFARTRGLGQGVPPNRGVMNNQAVLDLFAGHRLLAVLQGHLHVNEMLRWGETTFITGGAVCGKWWRGVWHGTDAGYGVLQFHPDRVDWSYRTYGWVPRRPEGS